MTSIPFVSPVPRDTNGIEVIKFIKSINHSLFVLFEGKFCMYRGVHVIASRIWHEICLLIEQYCY